MPLKNTQDRYGTVAMSAHWLTLLLLVGGFALGITMIGMEPSPERQQAFAYHKWIGVTIFFLALFRLTWRFVSPPPPLPASMPAAQRAAAIAVHWLLYLLVFAVPISGWLMSSAKGHTTVWFGVLPLPDLLAKDENLGEVIEDWHFWFNKTLAALVLGHMFVAVRHHFVNRDDILARMTPGLKAPSEKNA